MKRHRIMELLERIEDRGYPTEYLLSRIKARRADLITNWGPLILDIASFESVAPVRYRGFVSYKSPEGVWRRLIMEYRWVYRQMNEMLRKIFSPFFLYAELRTIFICLRRLKNIEPDKTDELLKQSLLSKETKTALAASRDILSAVSGIEHTFIPLSGEFKGLSEVFDAGGLRGVEQKIIKAYFIHIAKTRLHPLMGVFFARITDLRNIISLYKYLRLNMKAGPVFFSGGRIPETRLLDIFHKGDMSGVSSIIKESTGIKIDTPNTAQIERALYKGITRFLRKAGRDPLGIGVILDYLWRCGVEAMNLSLLFYGKGLEREAVTAKMVQ